VTRGETIQGAKKKVRAVLEKLLKTRAPKGYSLVIPPDGVMFVSDGIDQQHERWYVVVKPDPEYIAQTRKEEYMGILSDVEQLISKKYKYTVFLTSMLPVI